MSSFFVNASPFYIENRSCNAFKVFSKVKGQNQLSYFGDRRPDCSTDYYFIFFTATDAFFEGGGGAESWLLSGSTSQEAAMHSGHSEWMKRGGAVVAVLHGPFFSPLAIPCCTTRGPSNPRLRGPLRSWNCPGFCSTHGAHVDASHAWRARRQDGLGESRGRSKL